MQDEVERVVDTRNVVVRTVFSLRFVLSALMLFMYASGLVTWKVSSDSATDAINDLSDKLMTEIRSHIKDSMQHHLEVAETVTLMNAGLFTDGSLSEHNVTHFMGIFKMQLDAYRKSITTVSMTTKMGHLHGVYTDSVGIHKGYWSSNTSAAGKVQLYDFNTTLPLLHEGSLPAARLLYMEPDYNSSEQEWYTVCNAAIPNDKAWTSIYTMGSQTPVTMLSESTVSYTKSGLMGVTTIDMALGFAGELLRNVQLPLGYKAFVVDVKDVLRQGGVQAIIGTSDNTPLLYCRTSALVSVPMLGDECVAPGTIEFVPVNTTQVSYIKRTHFFVVENFGSWEGVTGVSDQLSVEGTKHFLSISTIQRKNLRWCVVILLPEEIFLEDINNTGRWLLVMYISVLVVKAFLSAIVIYFFIAPLRRLAIELDLLSEFKMDESSVIMSGWSEIRTLQLTFITLLKQMKVIKSYMPQALFADDDEEEPDSESAQSTRINSQGTTHTLDSTVRSVVVRQNMGVRTFDFKKHLAVMSVKVAHRHSDKECDKIHPLHCEFMERLSAATLSLKGVLDQISSETFNIVWGRDGFVNLNNVAEAVGLVKSMAFTGSVTVGCAVGQGVTGSAGGDAIRTVATLTDARVQANLLAALACYHDSPYLCTKKISEQTRSLFLWRACDLVRFANAKSTDVVYSYCGKKQDDEKEWMYEIDDGETVEGKLNELCLDMKNGKVHDAEKGMAKLQEMDTTKVASTIEHLGNILQNGCQPVKFGVNYHTAVLH